MDINDIGKLWAEDSKIDITELGEASLSIPKLHHKYYMIYIKERAKYILMENKLKKLKFEKRIFYIEGPNEETKKLGWNFPPKGAILKTDVQLYLDADPDISDATIKLFWQQEIVDYLKDIIKTISFRNQSISNALSDLKFKNGS